MKRGWLIYSSYEAERNRFFADKLIAAAKKRDIELKLLLREKIQLSLTDGFAAVKYDGQAQENALFALMRTDDFTLSFQLEQCGVRVFNKANTARICNDKYLSYLFASKLNIPVPDTFLVDKNTADWQNIDAALFPLIAKPLDGKGGKNVVMLNSVSDFLSVSKNYANRFLLQKVAKNVGVDMRAYCIGGKFFTAIKRISTTDFRSNYCLGGKAVPAVPDDEQTAAINKILKNLDTDYVGIDFIFDGEKALFNEIEDVVGARTVYNLTSLDIADTFMEYVSENI